MSHIFRYVEVVAEHPIKGWRGIVYDEDERWAYIKWDNNGLCGHFSHEGIEEVTQERIRWPQIHEIRQVEKL